MVLNARVLFEMAIPKPRAKTFILGW